MTVLALRYPRTPVAHGKSSRFGRGTRGHAAAIPMADPRTTKMEQIRLLVEQDAYDVDPQKVAEAIVQRLLDGRTMLDDRPKSLR